MITSPKGFRRYNDLLTLTKATVAIDDYGHASITGETEVGQVYGEVRQMSATKTALTFQQADIIGLELEFRKPAAAFDGITWRGHKLAFAQPEDVGNIGRVLKVSAYYQIDNPVA